MMTEVAIEKVYAGFRVDGLALLGGTCGCSGLTGPNGAGVGDCCQTYSKVRKDGNIITFFAKGTTLTTKNNFKSGYRVKKGPIEVDVTAYDTRDPKNFTFGGYYPPLLSEWQAKGWQVVQQIEEPLADTGVALLRWCQRASAGERPDPILSSPTVK